MKVYIKGNFKKTIFKSDKGYVIGLFRVKETNSAELEDFENKTITFTGYFHELNEEDMYIFYGESLEHPKYGFQFQVSEYERVKPEDKDGLIEFLSSDLFPGVGDKMAAAIVDTLGLDVLDKIMVDPAILNLVPKLTSKKATSIYNSLIKYNESSATIIYLTELGFSMKDAMSIYNVYKNMTKDIIEKNVKDLSVYEVLGPNTKINDLYFNEQEKAAVFDRLTSSGAPGNRDRYDPGGELWRDDRNAFDGRQYRDCGRDHAIAKKQGRTEQADGDQQAAAPGLALFAAQGQCQQ